MLQYVKISFAHPLCMLVSGLLASSTLIGTAHAMQSAKVDGIKGLQAPADSLQGEGIIELDLSRTCLLYTSPSPRD